jgi:hypothetical protein
MRFYVYLGARQVAQFDVDDLGRRDDPVAISVDVEFEPGARRPLLGINLAGPQAAFVGAWPDGDNWVPLASLNPLSIPPVP